MFRGWVVWVIGLVLEAFLPTVQPIRHADIGQGFLAVHQLVSKLRATDIQTVIDIPWSPPLSSVLAESWQTKPNMRKQNRSFAWPASFDKSADNELTATISTWLDWQPQPHR